VSKIYDDVSKSSDLLVISIFHEINFLDQVVVMLSFVSLKNVMRKMHLIVWMALILMDVKYVFNLLVMVVHQLQIVMKKKSRRRTRSRSRSPRRSKHRSRSGSNRRSRSRSASGSKRSNRHENGERDHRR